MNANSNTVCLHLFIKIAVSRISTSTILINNTKTGIIHLCCKQTASAHKFALNIMCAVSTWKTSLPFYWWKIGSCIFNRWTFLGELFIKSTKWSVNWGELNKFVFVVVVCLMKNHEKGIWRNIKSLYDLLVGWVALSFI